MERDEVSLRIDAPAEALYDLVSDVSAMGRWSPECTGGTWLGGASGPEVGARFRGSNRRGWVRWWTTNEVVAADPGREFAFETKQSGTRWGYRFDPEGDGATTVTEWREPFKERPRSARLVSALLLGGVEEHDDEMRQGMRATLERIKAAAES
jgi:dimethylaniline monooxygenase (N-oxide forming)